MARRKVSKVTAASELRVVGGEPVPQMITDNISMIKALGWYSLNKSNEECIPYLVHYLKETKHSPQDIQAVQRTEPWRLKHNVMSRARMLSRGFLFPEDQKIRFDEQLEKLLNVARKRSEELQEKNAVKGEPLYTSKDRESDIIAGIEEEIDAFYETNKFESPFSTYDYLKKNNANPRLISRIRQKYETVVSDVKSPEHENFMRPRLKNRYIAFLEKIVADCNALGSVAKAVKQVQRKPRKIKEKSAEQLTKGVRYQKEAPEFKIASHPPTAVLGAQQIYVFNTKSRNLFVYQAKNEKGFEFKGTKLLNWSDESSLKILRKPEEILPQITIGSKASLKKVMNAIRAVEKRPNGRFDEFTVILRVFK
ncbi:hypothetical protein [Caulobacter phage Cr30]|uniref:hypothetical protein n=1 Tax=Caulobacter phage Cr30 TaxID=1357714 RepID=UPI0004A9B5AA|nr:hypothetical protein OZ74_gp005 [Caulobacter phage Cr30]AGS80890.1 hypothetical protein [Caulobacter phage Cr30]